MRRSLVWRSEVATVVDCKRSKRGLQAMIVARAGAAADERQNLVGRGGHQARRAQAGVARLDDLAAAQIRTSASQMVAMPCSGTASTRMAMSFIR